MKLFVLIPLFHCRQLISGAEKLNLVAEILKSIDKISEIKDEEENEEEEEEC